MMNWRKCNKDMHNTCSHHIGIFFKFQSTVPLILWNGLD
jgi:hypothetical protein